MIRLITGTPGAGKTLLAVEIIRDIMNSDSPRPIYTNINGLNHASLRTFHLDEPISWFDLPDGSLIVIDECQQYFPPRPNGSKIPETVSRFETHRHQGLDVILISQHPRLLDQNIRRLVEHHQHCYRPFGMKQRTVLEWNVCNDDPTPKQSESSALAVKKRFDPALFQLYQSASIHTHQPRYPWKKFGILLASAAFVLGCALKFYLAKSPETDTAEPAVSQAKQQEIANHSAATSPESAPSGLLADSSLHRLEYRGNIKGPQGLIVWLEEPQTGRYYGLSDFSGYNKNPPHSVELFQSTGSTEVTYHVTSSDLYSMLP